MTGPGSGVLEIVLASTEPVRVDMICSGADTRGVAAETGSEKAVAGE